MDDEEVDYSSELIRDDTPEVLGAPPQRSHTEPATVMEGGVAIEATAATVAGTGVEMEAMVAASVAALTVYDMTKALDKGIRIREVVLLRKSGGKSGEWRRGQD